MALKHLLRPAPTPAADRPSGITCPKYVRGEGKRCAHFKANGKAAPAPPEPAPAPRTTETSVDYPLGPTLDVLSEATGRSREELTAELGTVDKKALDAELKRLGKSLDRSRVALLKAELEARAEKTHSPRFWAKEVA